MGGIWGINVQDSQFIEASFYLYTVSFGPHKGPLRLALLRKTKSRSYLHRVSPRVSCDVGTRHS